YPTLERWHKKDHLLAPIQCCPRHRGAYLWSDCEVQLAQLVAGLRDLRFPIPVIRKIIDRLRETTPTRSDAWHEAQVRLSVHVRDAVNHRFNKIAETNVWAMKEVGGCPTTRVCIECAGRVRAEDESAAKSRCCRQTYRLSSQSR